MGPLEADNKYDYCKKIYITLQQRRISVTTRCLVYQAVSQSVSGSFNRAFGKLLINARKVKSCTCVCAFFIVMCDTTSCNETMKKCLNKTKQVEVSFALLKS